MPRRPGRGGPGALRLHAHTLKSTAATMGARDCLRLAVELEAAAKAPRTPPQALAELLARLEKARKAATAAASGASAGQS